MKSEQEILQEIEELFQQELKNCVLIEQNWEEDTFEQSRLLFDESELMFHKIALLGQLAKNARIKIAEEHKTKKNQALESALGEKGYSDYLVRKAAFSKEREGYTEEDLMQKAHGHLEEIKIIIDKINKEIENEEK